MKLTNICFTFVVTKSRRYRKVTLLYSFCFGLEKDYYGASTNVTCWGFLKSKVRMANKLTTSEFIERAKNKHGDKYDYSKTTYIGIDKKVKIICNKHGEFIQLAQNHLIGVNCSKCAVENRPIGKKLTTELFVERSIKVHGTKYNYSIVEYKGTRNKVSIICPIHGEFKKIARDHLRGDGCNNCSIERKRKFLKESFIKKSIKINANRYDYSKVVYIKNNSKVVITCVKHGDFKQNPANHLNGAGCPFCNKERQSLSLSLRLRHPSTKTAAQFIIAAEKINGKRYDYSKFNYVSSRTKGIITCRIHGDFKQTPSSHLRGRQCNFCASHNRGAVSQSDFIKQAIKTHGEKYDYSNVKYTKIQEYITIGCKIHGQFKQMAKNHLKGIICPKCRMYKSFIKKAKLTHGVKYDYSLVNYVSCKDKVIIKCSKHGDFKQTPSHHLKGQGCPRCKRSKGEESVSKSLGKFNIMFVVEKTFKKCKNKRALPFDFYLPGYNLLIEYHGSQHYKVTSNGFFGGEKELIKRQNRDQIKKDFAINNGFNLLEIPYTEYENIETIIKNKLKELSNNEYKKAS